MKRIILLAIFLCVHSFALADCLNNVPIIGTGKPRTDPYRPDLPLAIQTMPDLKWSAFLPSNPDGSPKFLTAYVCFPDNVVLPPILSGSATKITAQQATTQIKLLDPTVDTDKLIPPPAITTGARLRDLFHRWGKYLELSVAWAVSASDNFNRADGAIGGSWSVEDTNGGTFFILSNVVETDSTQSAWYYSGISPGANQFSEIMVATFTGSSVSYLMINLRGAAAAGNPDRYRCMAARNDPYYGGKTSIITKIITGAETVLSSETSTTWVATDISRCSMSGTGISLNRNGGLLISASDSDLASGHIGVEIYTEEASFHNAQFDDWQGGDVVVASSKIRHRVSQ